ncbi:phosphatase PAP2 family protein [Halomonas sp. HP20-15]|uniref:phosphatase PAP2 family protein n=1 Tax=Halomonas sp. HP20-15 TaxID=3085901 RepID=UPI002981988D|nr:phosphatase PAP2 family protein [Halomonas sp. HP20-15]MDW5377830.1 phosphatase PAP2 family protein [Halomonas sp. HP20-15]
MYPRLKKDRPWLALGASWASFIALSIPYRHYAVDFTVADYLFNSEGNDWTLQHAWVTETLLHEGGRSFSELLAFLAIGGLITSFIRPSLRRWRRPLSYLVIAIAASTISIATLKQLISMDCPWDLARYGGELPFIGLFEMRPGNLPDSACFPAGHASAGYAWLALYFLFKATHPRWRWLGLAIGLAMGVAFGFAQQLRGAHFLSHDLWTLLICWTISALLARALLPLPEPTVAVTRPLAHPLNSNARPSS